MRQYLNRMREFLKVMELITAYLVSLQIARQKLLQLKLDSLPSHYFFIEFDWLSCAI